MGMKVQRLVAYSLTWVLVLSLLAGCGSKPAKVEVPSPATAAGDDIKFPITGKNIELKYWIPLHSKAAAIVKSYSELSLFQEMEKRTGIKINFIHPPVGQESEQFNLMVAANEMPDLVYYKWSSAPGGIERFLNDNIIIDLNSSIDKYALNYKKLLEENPSIKKEIVTDDNKIFMFSMLMADPSLRLYNGLQVREDWLKKLNLKAPENLDDWYTMLKAFKEKDPNGNGKADELPFISQKRDGLMNFAAPFGVTDGFYLENGTVKYGPLEPRFKEAITFIRKLYSEKLVDQEYLITDGKQFDAKILGNQAGAYQGAVSGTMGKYLTSMKDKDPNFSLIGVPFPKGADGKRTRIGSSLISASTGAGTAITAKNKFVPETAKWLDYAYGTEGSLLMNFGIEGVSYKMENGQPKYTDEILNNSKGLAPSDALTKYAMSIMEGPMNQDIRYLQQVQIFPQQKAALNTWKDVYLDKSLPRLSSTKDETTRYAAVMNDVDTYKNEMLDKLIMGVEPFDNYDKFVKQMKTLNIDEALKIQQAAYDRFNKRK